VLEVVELGPGLRRAIQLEEAEAPLSAVLLVRPHASPSPAPRSGGDGDDLVCLVHRNGSVKFFDTNHERLARDLGTWQSMFPAERGGGRGLEITRTGGPDETGSPKTGLDAPKHGKEDAKNEPHVGGNTWAGRCILFSCHVFLDHLYCMQFVV
jgi:hypothetical protein